MSLSSANYDPAVRAGAKIGHFSGGGLVTQATNRSTGVTINQLSGTITTNTTSLAAAASAVFTVTNNTVALDDVVLLTVQSGSSNAAGTAGGTVVQVSVVAAGSFNIQVNNLSTTTAETGAILINFLVMKAAQS